MSDPYSQDHVADVIIDSFTDYMKQQVVDFILSDAVGMMPLKGSDGIYMHTSWTRGAKKLRCRITPDEKLTMLLHTHPLWICESDSFNKNMKYEIHHRFVDRDFKLKLLLPNLDELIMMKLL